MMGDNGNFLSGKYNNSDDDSYKTPPETLDTESEPEYDNNLENDTALDLHKLLNFPGILDLKTGQNTSNSDNEQSDMREYPP